MIQTDSSARASAALSGKTESLETAVERVFPELLSLSIPEQARLFQSANRLSLPADTILLKEGDACPAFIILLEGAVRVYQHADDGREITLYRLHPGDICVMSLNSLMHNQPFRGTARAESPVRALALPRQTFLDLMAHSELFRIHILASVSDHFCDMLSLVQEMVFNKLDTRLACLLGSLFEKNQGSSVKVTHQELANELGTTREVVSRLLKGLERQGCIRLSRGRISLASENSPRWFDHLRGTSSE